MPYTFIITQQEYNFILQNRKTLLINYEIQEVDCQQCKKEHPSNSKKIDVHAKVSILNSFYSTRVTVDSMVDNIIKQATYNDLEKNLNSGKPEAVQKIAIVGTKDNFSFATKYCALMQPDKYPIYDSLVWLFLTELKNKGFFSKVTMKKFAKVNKNRSRAYQEYVDIYDEFINKSGIKPFYKNYHEVDKFIWGACEMYIFLEKKSKHTSIKPGSQWLSSFSSSLLAQLTSTAIWNILSLIIKL